MHVRLDTKMAWSYVSGFQKVGSSGSKCRFTTTKWKASISSVTFCKSLDVLDEAVTRLQGLQGLKIAAVQHDIVWEDPPANFERLGPRLQSAAAAGAQLLVLTEMFSTGFTMNSELCAESLEGPSCEFLSTQATTLQVWVTGSIPTRWDDGIAYNTLVLATNRRPIPL